MGCSGMCEGQRQREEEAAGATSVLPSGCGNEFGFYFKAMECWRKVFNIENNIT